MGLHVWAGPFSTRAPEPGSWLLQARPERRAARGRLWVLDGLHLDVGLGGPGEELGDGGPEDARAAQLVGDVHLDVEGVVGEAGEVDVEAVGGLVAGLGVEGELLEGLVRESLLESTEEIGTVRR